MGWWFNYPLSKSCTVIHKIPALHAKAIDSTDLGLLKSTQLKALKGTAKVWGSRRMRANPLVNHSRVGADLLTYKEWSRGLKHTTEGTCGDLIHIPPMEG